MVNIELLKKHGLVSVQAHATPKKEVKKKLNTKPGKEYLEEFYKFKKLAKDHTPVQIMEIMGINYMRLAYYRELLRNAGIRMLKSPITGTLKERIVERLKVDPPKKTETLKQWTKRNGFSDENYKSVVTYSRDIRHHD